MKLGFILLTLLATGSSARVNNGRTPYQTKYGFKCRPRNIETTLQPCTSLPVTTSAPPTTTLWPYLGCESCLNDRLSVGDTFAGYCFPSPSQDGCHCLCADLFCYDGQIIDRTTCVNGGSMADCKCIDPFISTSTDAPTTPTTTIASYEYDY